MAGGGDRPEPGRAGSCWRLSSRYSSRAPWSSCPGCSPARSSCTRQSFASCSWRSATPPVSRRGGAGARSDDAAVELIERRPTVEELVPTRIGGQRPGRFSRRPRRNDWVAALADGLRQNEAVWVVLPWEKGIGDAAYA